MKNRNKSSVNSLAKASAAPARIAIVMDKGNRQRKRKRESARHRAKQRACSRHLARERRSNGERHRERHHEGEPAEENAGNRLRNRIISAERRPGLLDQAQQVPE